MAKPQHIVILELSGGAVGAHHAPCGTRTAWLDCLRWCFTVCTSPNRRCRNRHGRNSRLDRGRRIRRPRLQRRLGLVYTVKHHRRQSSPAVRVPHEPWCAPTAPRDSLSMTMCGGFAKNTPHLCQLRLRLPQPRPQCLRLHRRWPSPLPHFGSPAKTRPQCPRLSQLRMPSDDDLVIPIPDSIVRRSSGKRRLPSHMGGGCGKK